MGIAPFKRFCLVIVSLFAMGMGSVAIAAEYKFAYSVPYKSANFSKNLKLKILRPLLIKLPRRSGRSFCYRFHRRN